MNRTKKIFSTFLALTMCAGLFTQIVNAETIVVPIKTIYQEDFSEDYTTHIVGNIGTEYIGTETASDSAHRNYSVFQYSNASGNMNIGMNSTSKLLTIETTNTNDKGVLFINRNMLYDRGMSSDHEISITARRDGDDKTGKSSINTSFGMRLRSHGDYVLDYNKDYYEAGITTSYTVPGEYDGTGDFPDRPYILKYVDTDFTNGLTKGTYYLYTFSEVPRLQQNQTFDLTSGVVTGTDNGTTYDKIYTKGRFVAKGTPSTASGNRAIAADTNKGILGGAYSWTTENVDGVTYVNFEAYVLDSKRFNDKATNIAASQSGITLTSNGGAASATSNGFFEISSLKVNSVQEAATVPTYDLRDGKTATETFSEAFSADVANGSTVADIGKDVNVTDDWKIRGNVNGYGSTALSINSANGNMTMTQATNKDTGVLEIRHLENKGHYKNPNHEITVQAKRDDGSNAAIETAFGLRLKGTGTYRKTYYETGVSSSYNAAGNQYTNFSYDNNDRPYILKYIDGADNERYSSAGLSSGTVYHYMFNNMPRLKQWETFELTGGVVSGTTSGNVPYDKIYVKGSYQVRDQGSFGLTGYTQIPADNNIAGGGYKYIVENNVCTFEGYIIDIKPFYAYRDEANDPSVFTSGISLCASNWASTEAKFDITGVTLKRLGDEILKPVVTAASANGTVSVAVTNAADIMDTAGISETPVAICAFYNGDKLLSVETKAVQAITGTQTIEFEDPQAAGEAGWFYIWNSVSGGVPIYEPVEIK